MNREEDFLVGEPVAPVESKRPSRATLEGSGVILAPLDPSAHGETLWQGAGGEENAGLWRYLFAGPFSDRRAFDEYLDKSATSDEPLFFAIVDRPSAKAAGMAAYLNVNPAHRTIEVGSILFLPGFQRSRGATEAMYLMARHAFEDLGYRRYEWKCNALNLPSRRAALRLGFTYEGIFRRHMIVKGRSRDTAWFSMIDSEWAARKARFQRWLDPANFDADGRQKTPLSAMSL